MSYQVGGTLPPNNPHYVEREADRQLFQSLLKGDFCYVFNSRQTGKSSLQVHVRKKLEAQEIICTYIDLSGIDTDTNIESWYLTIIDEIAANLLPEFNLFAWWDEIEEISIFTKFRKFFEQVLFQEIKQNIIIFIDEIDTVLSLNFKTDDFFRFIRSCYNKRAVHSEYKRLSFCLLGVTAPSYLIDDKQNTPFNIGKAIELKGFTFSEAETSLTKGLEQKIDVPKTVLKQILDWTGGQPFLTVKLLQLVIENPSNRKPNINELVKKYILENWSSQDHPEHLKTIKDRLLLQKHLSQKILILYQDILHGSNKANGRDREYAKIELLLSGLVINKNGYLVVNNKIYQNIFSLDWIKSELTKLLSEQRPKWYLEKITLWLNYNRQDKSLLLTSEELRNFQQWTSDDRRLNKEDLGFLYQSIKQIEAKTQRGKQEALEAKLKATEEKKKAYKILASLASVTGLIIVSIFCCLWYNAKQEKQNQISQGLVKSAELEYRHNVERSILLYAEALKHKPSIFLKLNFYQRLALLSPLKQQLFFKYNDTNCRDNSEVKTRKTSNLKTINDCSIYSSNGFNSKSFFCQLPNDSIMTAISFASDSDLFATASLDGITQIWKTEKISNYPQENFSDTCSHLVKYINDESSINALAFSVDNNYLATANNEGNLQIFIQDTGKVISLNSLEKSHILALKFSPDSKYLISGDLQGFLKVWDVSNAKNVATFQLKYRINDISFSPKGEYLAIASANTLYLIDTDTIKESNYLINSNTKQINLDFSIFSVNFSPNGKYLAVGSADNTARVWNISQIGKFPRALVTDNQLSLRKTENRQQSRKKCPSLDDDCDNADTINLLREKNIFKHQSKVNVVKFSPDSQYLLTGSDDHTGRLWYVEDGNLITQTFHPAPVIDVAFLNTGQIATVSWDYTVKIWDDLAQRVVKLIKSEQTWQHLVFNSESNYLASQDSENNLKIWNLKTSNLSSQIHLDISFNQNVDNIYLSPQGNYLAIINDNKVQIWQKNIHHKWTKKASLIHPDTVHQLIINNQEQHLITLSDDLKLRLWNLNHSLNFAKAQIVTNKKEIETVLFTPKDDYLVIIEPRQKNKILSFKKIPLSEKEKIIEIKLPQKLRKTNKIIFDQEQSSFVTISNDNYLCIWNIGNWNINNLTKVKCKSLNKNPYNLLNFDSKGNYFATVRDKKTWLVRKERRRNKKMIPISIHTFNCPLGSISP
ncbi:MAG: hypothetical protein F6K10_19970 [Moorea sp. SIO2B7]|nr:hypothetical protein [Moorena sp. SIO2B7]